jgi:hypothetical protein
MISDCCQGTQSLSCVTNTCCVPVGGNCTLQSDCCSDVPSGCFNGQCM